MQIYAMLRMNIVTAQSGHRDRITLRMSLSLAIVFIAAVLISLQTQGQEPALKPSPATPLFDQAVQRRANELLKTMSTEEKIGQLSQVFFFAPSASLDEKIRKGEVGSVLFTADPAQIDRMQRIAVNESPHHIPLLFGYDAIHGVRTIFPVPIAIAASWDPSVAEAEQRDAASEARAVGVQWVFAPMVDITRDPRWGRIVEGAGEDPFLGSAMAQAQVRGFQGDHLGQAGHVVACAKHFAGYGASEGGRDYDAADISDAQLWNVYLTPFHAAVTAGVGTLMSAYMDLNDVPATANRWLLHDVLRGSWQFNGFVVSDADSVKGLKAHGLVNNLTDAAAIAFGAGVNMEMAVGKTAYSSGLLDALQNGRISTGAIDDAVRPILETKLALSLFEQPYADDSRTTTAKNDPAHLDSARNAAEKSAVLLRNQNGLLPLKGDAYKRIAVIGPMADSGPDLLGPWAFAADPTATMTIAEGIRHKLGPKAIVKTTAGVQLARKFPSPFDQLSKVPKDAPRSETQAKDEFAKAIETARESDLVILALGELPIMSGEAASVSTLDLPGQQEKLLEAVAATGKPVVLVLINGRPLDIRWATEHVSVILEAWFPGEEGASAIANLLFGDAVPGGKLPFTWPRNAGQVPIFYAHNNTHTPTTQSKRYWNEESTPLFPFGYGLSYAKFVYSNLRVDAPAIKPGDTVKVSVDIENQSDVAGDEVAQLYIHQESGSVSRPVRELKGFQRVLFQPHEKKTIQFSLGREERIYWSSTTRGWVLDSAVFDVWVGEDSNAALHGSFVVVP